MIHLFQKTQLGFPLSQPTQEHGLKKKCVRFSVLPSCILCGGLIFVSKKSYRFDDDRLMLVFIFLKTMPGYDIFLKTFILKAIVFLIQLKDRRRIIKMRGSLAFGRVIHSLSEVSLLTLKPGPRSPPSEQSEAFLIGNILAWKRG